MNDSSLIMETINNSSLIMETTNNSSLIMETTNNSSLIMETTNNSSLMMDTMNNSSLMMDTMNGSSALMPSSMGNSSNDTMSDDYDYYYGDPCASGAPMFPPHILELIKQFIRVNFISSGVILPIIIVVGMIGNILNLCVFFGSKLKAGTYYLYLKYMAISDLCTMLLLWPAVFRHGHEHAFDSHHSNFYFAHLEPVLLNLFLIASALLVLAIAADRYIAVCHPLKARYLVPRSLHIAIVCASFILPALFLIPLGFKQAVEPGLCSGHRVGVDPDANLEAFKVYHWFQVALFKFIPILLVATMNCASMIKFWQHRQNRAARTAGRSNTGKKAVQDNRFMVMLGCIALMYVLFITPSAILFIMDHPDLHMSLSFHMFRAAANTLEFLNSSMNFYIYCLSSQDFRRHFKQLFLGKSGLLRTGWSKTWSRTGSTVVSQSQGQSNKRKMSKVSGLELENVASTSGPDTNTTTTQAGPTTAADINYNTPTY